MDDEASTVGVEKAFFPREVEGESFAHLCAETVSEHRWVMPGIIPEGFTLLGGKVKSGKSALTEYLSSLIGQTQRVCYFALEYNRNLLIKRLKALNRVIPDSPYAKFWHQYQVQEHVSKSGITQVEFIRQRVEENQPYLVVVDTLARAKRKTSGSYDEEYEATLEIKKIADEYSTNLIAVHHTRKSSADGEIDWGDEFLGSTGIAATPDHTVLYDRPNGSTRVRGRGRMVEEYETFLEFDQGVFTAIDDGQVHWAMLNKLKPSQAFVLFALMDGPASAKELTGRCNEGSEKSDKYTVQRIHNILRQGREAGFVSQTKYGSKYEYVGPIPSSKVSVDPKGSVKPVKVVNPRLTD